MFFIVTHFRCVLTCVVVRATQELLEHFRADPKCPAQRVPKEQWTITGANGEGTTLRGACPEPRRKSLSKGQGITTCFAHLHFPTQWQINWDCPANCLIASTALLHSLTTLLWQQIACDYTNKIKKLTLHKIRIQRQQIMLLPVSSSPSKARITAPTCTVLRSPLPGHIATPPLSPSPPPLLTNQHLHAPASHFCMMPRKTSEGVSIPSTTHLQFGTNTEDIHPKMCILNDSKAFPRCAVTSFIRT